MAGMVDGDAQSIFKFNEGVGEFLIPRIRNVVSRQIQGIQLPGGRRLPLQAHPGHNGVVFRIQVARQGDRFHQWRR